MVKIKFTRSDALIVLVGLLGLITIGWSWGLLPFFSNNKQANEAYVVSSLLPINSGVDGLVNKIYIKDYQIVKKGDLLFSFDTSLEDAKLESLSDKARLADSKLRQLQQKQTKHSSKSTAISYQILVERLKALSSEINYLKLCKDRKIIKSPVDGYAGRISVSEGEYVNRSTQLVMLIVKDKWVEGNFKEKDGSGCLRRRRKARSLLHGWKALGYNQSEKTFRDRE